MSNISWKVSGIEQGPFEYVWTPEINPVEPERFDIQQISDGVQLFCAGKAYAGALAKHVIRIPAVPHIEFKYSVTLDESISRAQVIETDMKLTDAFGWTYDGSLQFNIADDWMVQVGDPWVDTGYRFKLFPGANTVIIDYELDFANHALKVPYINGIALGAPAIAARQLGWESSTLVTQLQLCTNALGGIYDLVFREISYTGVSDAK